jgi:hypothetical protein
MRVHGTWTVAIRGGYIDRIGVTRLSKAFDIQHRRVHQALFTVPQKIEIQQSIGWCVPAHGNVQRRRVRGTRQSGFEAWVESGHTPECDAWRSAQKCTPGIFCCVAKNKNTTIKRRGVIHARAAAIRRGDISGMTGNVRCYTTINWDGGP